MSAREKAREKDKEEGNQRQRYVAAQAVAPHGGRGKGSQRGHRIPARATTRGVLEGDALPMLVGVLTVSDIQVREIMVPRAQMTVLTAMTNHTCCSGR